MSKKTNLEKILALLSKESPLGPANISEKLDMPITTVKSLLSIARKLGAVQYHKGIRGSYELTEHGKSLLEDKG